MKWKNDEKQNRILSAELVREFDPNKQIKAQLSTANEKLAGIQARAADYEKLYNELVGQMEALNTQKTACIENIAAGIDDTPRLDKITFERQNIRNKQADITDLLAEIKKIEEKAAGEVKALSAKVIPAYREALQRIATLDSENIRNAVGDDILTIIAILGLAGFESPPEAKLMKIFFPQGFYRTELFSRMAAIKAEIESLII